MPAPMASDPRPCEPTRPSPSRWRFSLGSILLLMTVASLALGLIRAVPMSNEMRQAMLVLSLVWGLVALIVLAPLWLRYANLQRQVAARHTEMQRWLNEFRASHSEPDSPPQKPPQGPQSEP